MTWISVDPGAVHVGVALWEVNDLVVAKEVTPDDFVDFFATTSATKVVIESFSLKGNRANGKGAKEAIATIELIGWTRYHAARSYKEFFTQQPAVRTIAMKGPFYRDLKLDEKWGPILRNDHIASAVCHGLYHKHFGKGKA